MAGKKVAKKKQKVSKKASGEVAVSSKYPKLGEMVKNKNVINYVLSRNREQSEIFSSPTAILEREQYLAKHPTLFLAFKCMDGRLNVPFITEVPTGIIRPLRNLGGKFDLGWPLLRRIVTDLVMGAAKAGHGTIMFITYHFSEGDIHRGCKGFGYDKEKSVEAARDLVEQARRIYGRGAVYPIKVGIETDSDGLIFHGLNGKVLDISRNVPLSEDQIWHELMHLYPDMEKQMLVDLNELAVGNLRHVRKVRAEGREFEDLDHREQILGLGRGFDWLHEPNKALLIGPFSSELKDPIEKAAGILLDNIKSKRIPKEDGVVLMASAAYPGDGDINKFGAMEEARWKAKIMLETVAERVPELLPYARVVAGVVSMQTRLYTCVDVKDLV